MSSGPQPLPPQAFDELAGIIDAARDAERTRLADALHDDALQLLAAAAQDLQELAADGGGAGAEDARRRLADATDAVRSLVRSSHDVALDAAGLPEAIGRLVEDAARRGRLVGRSHVTVDDLRPGDMGLVRAIVREACENVVRHAHATELRAWVERRGRSLHVGVADDGLGLREADRQEGARTGHLGLARIERRVAARGGNLVVRGRPGGGTEVHVDLPLEAPGDPASAGRLLPSANELLGHIAPAWLLVRRDGSYEHVSDAACRMLGRPRAELMATPVALRSWWSDPAINQRARDQALTELSARNANVVLTPDGRRRPVEIESHRLPPAEDGEPLVLCFLR